MKVVARVRSATTPPLGRAVRIGSPSMARPHLEVLDTARSDLLELTNLRGQLLNLRNDERQQESGIVRDSAASAELDRLISRKKSEVDALTALEQELHDRKSYRLRNHT